MLLVIFQSSSKQEPRKVFVNVTTAFSFPKIAHDLLKGSPYIESVYSEPIQFLILLANRIHSIGGILKL